VFISVTARRVLKVLTAIGLVFLYLPIAFVLIASFNKAKVFSWPPEGATLHWWTLGVKNQGALSALGNSVKIATVASLIALSLGTMAAFAVHKFRFFGREALSFLVVLPIALPGIVTGIALNSAFRQLGVDFGFLTVIVAHSTFCIVIVYNNVVARLRRMQASLEEASADLGANGFTTFRLVTFPLIRSALLAAGLLAFALSFDEIVVTTFTFINVGSKQTLPQWILNNLSRPRQAPIVTAVAVMIGVLSIVPIYLAQRLTDHEPGVAGR
jgi:putative spermidine/putrescine transport system permease protein